MSFLKTDQVFPSKNEENITQVIAAILREEYGSVGSATKRIARNVGAEPRTVKNWYEGRSAPNLAHFIALARTSKRLVECFLELCGYEDLAGLVRDRIASIELESIPAQLQFYRLNFDTIKLKSNIEALQNLNQRQIWFYSELQQGRRRTSRDMVSFWNIGTSTAKRDIAGLVETGLISFVGSKRTGYYSPL